VPLDINAVQALVSQYWREAFLRPVAAKNLAFSHA
jgi:hypothetical protein